MSLDVYLEGEPHQVRCTCPECYHEHERTKCERFFSRNITHNLTGMADSARIYEHLWRPEEVGITKASQLIEPLEAGLARLEADPEKFRAHNPPNGWGSYEGLCAFVRAYLAACRENPEANVSVSR